MKFSIYIKNSLMLSMLISVAAPRELLATARKNKVTFDHCADYVIIGMGGAGCVLASRLTDDKKTSVIGLESGSNDIDQELISDPSFNGELDHEYHPQFFWQGETVPQPQLADQSFHWTNGRIFGGGLSINGLQFVRGTAELWKQYEDALGQDWAVDAVFRRYKELETYTGQSLHPINRGTHGKWINMALPQNPTDDARFLLKAFEAVSGLPEVIDYNDQFEGPVGPFLRWNLQINPETGLRTSSANGFLGTDAMSKEGKGLNGRKLNVFFQSTVVSFIWDECESNKVIGVRYVQNGKFFTAKATKAVILSAGFQSAQLLQTEGIGPKKVLDAAHIPVRVENAHVGNTLTNHPLIEGIIFSTPGLDVVPEGEFYSFYTPGAFLPDPSPAGSPNIRGFQWITIPILEDEEEKKVAFHGPEGEGNQLALIPLLLFPKSVGTITVQNADPLKIALANVNYLSNPEDLESFKTAISQFVLGLDDYFKLNKPEWSLLSPSREVIENDKLLTEFIKEFIEQAHHWSGTCLMARSAADGVVDSRGRVFGVEGLIVADDSILKTVDGNLGGPAVLIGYTLSEFLLEEQTKGCSKKLK